MQVSVLDSRGCLWGQWDCCKVCLNACSDAVTVLLHFVIQGMVKVKENTAAFEIGFQVLVEFKLCVTFTVADASISSVMFEIVGVITVRYNE